MDQYHPYVSLRTRTIRPATNHTTPFFASFSEAVQGLTASDIFLLNARVTSGPVPAAPFSLTEFVFEIEALDQVGVRVHTCKQRVEGGGGGEGERGGGKRE